MSALPQFRNEPVLELRRPEARDSLLAGLRELERALPLHVPVWVGEEAGGDTVLRSTDPGAPDRLVAEAGRATPSDVDAAVAAAERGAREWGGRPAAERAEVLRGAAAWLRERRALVAALEVRECAKPWPEADADVCEAIDFLEYYARGAIALESGRELIQMPGERNTLRYAPRGVVGVIAPWNFPVAIPAGMTGAALATGNAAILKPAEQSPGCGLLLMQALRESGVPAQALSLLPGEGDTGAALVRHPGVHTIAFTGSAAVGLEILRTAAEPLPGQAHVKRVVAEMGGKNCVIVDSDADLDDAVPAIAASAFGYAGQKCSAAGRVLAHEAVAEALLERLAGATEVLQVGQANVFGTDVPPLIDRAAQERVHGYAKRAARDGQVLAQGGPPPQGGWFCAPTLAADLDSGSPVLSEEVFGPLLTVERVPSVHAACEVVESLPFALTGGLFSRNPETIEEVTRRSPVGNLYINRPITGAVVGRQPFGGNRLSGTGSKAGGPDYLLAFVEPRVASESTVRHGLVVE